MNTRTAIAVIALAIAAASYCPSEQPPLTHPEVQRTIDAIKLDLAPQPDPISTTTTCNCKPTCQCLDGQCGGTNCTTPAEQKEEPAPPAPAAKAAPQSACRPGDACYRPQQRRGLFGRGFF